MLQVGLNSLTKTRAPLNWEHKSFSHRTTRDALQEFCNFRSYEPILSYSLYVI